MYYPTQKVSTNKLLMSYRRGPQILEAEEKYRKFGSNKGHKLR